MGPLEQALQIYTDMNNAPQAAACHYQVPDSFRETAVTCDGNRCFLTGVLRTDNRPVGEARACWHTIVSLLFFLCLGRPERLFRPQPKP